MVITFGGNIKRQCVFWINFDEQKHTNSFIFASEKGLPAKHNVM